MSRAPKWLALLAAPPDDAVPTRKPVASPELIASGKADAIVGWDSIMIDLSAGLAGLRHVQRGGDKVMAKQSTPTARIAEVQPRGK